MPRTCAALPWLSPASHSREHVILRQVLVEGLVNSRAVVQYDATGLRLACVLRVCVIVGRIRGRGFVWDRFASYQELHGALLLVQLQLQNIRYIVPLPCIMCML